jgi:hypothetical protein
MPLPCEICERLDPTDRPRQTGRPRTRHLLVEQRIVRLCDEHAQSFRSTGASDLETLRALFVEQSGRRAVLERRARLDRRVFPPRPEGRRRNQGRRGTDPAF